VVTTTLETRGLPLKMRVSVTTPFASVVVVMVELSGPGRVVVVARFALTFVFVSGVLHAGANAARAITQIPAKSL
jgi:hypothetical protein